MPFCSKCGTEIQANLCYCTVCGQAQEESTFHSSENNNPSVTKRIKSKYKPLLLMGTIMLIILSLFTVDYYAFNFIPVKKTIDWNMGGITHGEYSGTVRYRMPNGKGRFVITSSLDAGSEYVGDWLDGRRHGFGTMTFTMGDRVTGEWEQDALIYGTYFYANGATYQGQFNYGKRHGEGTFTAPDGSIYQGQWKDGHLHGQGTWTTRDAKYVGGFQNGLWHGQGTMTFYDGTVLSGVWINGEFTGTYPDKPPPQVRYWGN